MLAALAVAAGLIGANFHFLSDVIAGTPSSALRPAGWRSCWFERRGGSAVDPRRMLSRGALASLSLAADQVEVDHHALMGAAADLFGFVARAHLELDTAGRRPWSPRRRP